MLESRHFNLSPLTHISAVAKDSSRQHMLRKARVHSKNMAGVLSCLGGVMPVYRSLAMCAVETFVCRIAESSDSTARDLLYSRLELWHRWLAHQPWFIEGTWQTEEPQLTKRSFPSKEFP